MSITRCLPSRARRRRSRAGSTRVAGLALAALCAVLFGFGGLAWRFFAAPVRAADAVVAYLIPADVDAVALLSLSPTTAEQAVTFQKIGHALRREDLEARLERLWQRADAVRVGPFAGRLGEEVRREFAGSFAVVSVPDRSVWPSVCRTAFLARLKNHRAVSRRLREGAVASREVAGVTVWEFGDGVFAAVVRETLVVATEPDGIRPFAETSTRQRRALARNADFRQARAALPRGANLTVFLSEDGIRNAYQPQQHGPLVPPLKGVRWVAAAATIRTGGVAVEWRAPWTGASTTGAAPSLAAIPPLSRSALGRLPTGAVAAAAVSQPSRYGEFTRDLLRAEIGPSGFEDALGRLERETGLSLDGDVLPGFRGNTVLALYPDRAREGADALLVVDDARGADPAKLAAAVRRLAERSDANLRFDREERRGGITVWTPYRADEAFTDAAVGTGPARNKEVLSATVGKTVIAATSPVLLDRAVAAAAHGEDTSDDALASQVPEGAQWAAIIHPGRAADLLGVLLSSHHATDTAVRPADVLRLFGAEGNRALVASVRCDGTMVCGSLFLPVDYEAGITLLGRALPE
jgi:Protein of unknown function (DUF3352).